MVEKTPTIRRRAGASGKPHWHDYRIGAACVLTTVTGLAGCSAEDGEFGSAGQSYRVDAITQFQQGVTPGDYAGNEDSTIRKRFPTMNLGQSSTCAAKGGYSTSESCVMRWSLEGLPDGAIIDDAILTVQVTNGTTDNYGVWALDRAWEESSVSWANAASGDPWSIPGALGSADRGAFVGRITGGTGRRAVTLYSTAIDVIQGWVDGEPNHGLIIADRIDDDLLQFASSEHPDPSYRPRLTLYYHYDSPSTPPPTGGTSPSTSSPTGGTTSSHPRQNRHFALPAGLRPTDDQRASSRSAPKLSVGRHFLKTRSGALQAGEQRGEIAAEDCACFDRFPCL